MSGNETSETIVWRIALKSSCQRVYGLLTSPQGRARFWAESAEESQGEIRFRFPSGQELISQVRDCVPDQRFVLTYFGGSQVEFTLESDGGQGCLLTLRETGLSESEAWENRPGWVSVLLNLKACADFNVDLRNHDPERSWDEGFVDN